MNELIYLEAVKDGKDIIGFEFSSTDEEKNETKKLYLPIVGVVGLSENNCISIIRFLVNCLGDK